MKFWKYFLALLLLVAATTGFAAASAPDPKFHLIACDVGQGDGLLAVYKNTQFLIDGGPNNKVLDCLSKYMPFWDREIEVVVSTHPQSDHFTGLIEVLKRYKVDKFIAAPLDNSSNGYRVLKEVVGGQEVEVVNPISGMVIGNTLMYLDILHPSQEYIAQNTSSTILGGVDSSANVLGAYISNLDANNFSVVAILRFGEFDALLTGDMSPEISNQLAEKINSPLDYIKIPHHGSKNGLTRSLLEKIAPKVAVISVGKNSYGHPHEEILKLLREKDIKILRTDQDGDVEVISDGKSWWVGK